MILFGDKLLCNQKKMLWYDIIWGRTLLQPPVPIKKKLPQAMNLKGWPVMCGLKQ